MGLFSKYKAESLKEVRRLFLFFILVVVILVLPLVISSIINDIGLALFSLQLERCTLPPDTGVLDHAAVCGKLNGNGNGMDFLAVILVQSEQLQEDLVQYFNSYSFRPVKGKDAKQVTIEVMRAASPDVAIGKKTKLLMTTAIM